MTERKQLTLRRMEAGQTGTVIQISGGHGLVRRLEAMGIRPSKKITKVSSTFLRGPVTFKVDHAQIAIGFGIANKILVEVDNSD